MQQFSGWADGGARRKGIDLAEVFPRADALRLWAASEVEDPVERHLSIERETRRLQVLYPSLFRPEVFLEKRHGGDEDFTKE